MIQTLLGDFSTALRGLARRPAYTLTAVVVLALGLTAGLGVFTYANGFRQPFPGVRSSGLVQVHDATDEEPFGAVSYLDYEDYRGQTGGALEGVAAAQAGYAASVRHEESTEVVFLEAVSGSFFPVLDVEMSVGRGLGPDDDRPGADPVAVLSYRWWQRQWNGDPDVLGSVVFFNFRPYTVVGVAGPGFRGTVASYRPDAWLPFAPFGDRYTNWAQAAEIRDQPLVRVYARLGGGVTPSGAQEALRRVGRGLDEAYPREQPEPRRPTVSPATWIDPRARAEEAGTLRVMLAAAVGFLLLVCANVANLLLAGALGRRREMALRAALGASRSRLFRRTLVEGLLLGAAAGAVALVVAGPVALRLGSYFARPSVWGENVAREMTVDGRVLLAGLALTVLASVLAGLLPALAAARHDVAEALRSTVGGMASPPWRIGRLAIPGASELMISAQVALSLLLMVVGGLTLRTLSNVDALTPGFETGRLIASYVSTSSTGVTVEERDGWFRELARRLGEEPWIRSATVSGQAPLSPHPSAPFRLGEADTEVDLTYANVIPGYFQTLGMEVVRGRGFQEEDTLGAPGVAVVNEGLVRRYLPGSDGLGRRIRRDGQGADDAGEYEIVGVVSDARIQDLLSEPEPVVYLSNPQQGYPSGSALTVAVEGDPAAAAARLRRWLRDYESHMAIVNVIPYPDVERGFTYAQRMNAQMFTSLALLGLVLSLVGIFSVMTLAVGQRTREIGVRMALGAQRGQVGQMMLRRMLTPVALGLGVGGTVSVLGADLAQSMLYGVQAVDPASLLGAGAVFALAAAAAVAVPVRRATGVDPVESLRNE